MADHREPSTGGSKSELILYQTEDKRTQIDVRLEGETVWLSQAQMVELFQTTKQNISLHIHNVFDEGELQEDSVVKDYLTTAADGKGYQTKHYNLDVIISVGYRVKSHRGTQFRIWATQRLKEYLIKGFTLDDQRLMEGGNASRYFEELLERVRTIRTSERMFWQKVTDIYATSIDYDTNNTITREFFATVQNKFHFAIHGHTAAEIVAQRADAAKPNMGLTSWKSAPGGSIRRGDVTIAKNYLQVEKLQQLNLIVDQYLSFAELQARQRKAMHMADWVRKLPDFLTLNDREILKDAGKVSHELARELAEKQFDRFEAQQREIEANSPVSDFDQHVRQIEAVRKMPPKKRPKNTKGES